MKNVLNNVAATPVRELQAIKSGDRTVYSSEDKSEVFAEHFANVFQDRCDLNFSQAELANFELVRSQVENELTLKPTIPSETSTETSIRNLISESDLVATLKALKKTSPGEDRIHNAVLKKDSVQFRQCLLTLFRVVLSTGIVPRTWKHGVVCLIEKPGKDPTTCKGYRPITLINTIAKLFDKIVAYKLRRELEAANWLCAEQSAYRPRHGCPDHLYRLSRDASQALQSGRECTAVSLDVEAAFDTISHSLLRSKVVNCPIHPLWKRYLSESLRDRQFQVRVEGVVSRPQSIGAGVPQGSVLSPTLFLIFVNDLFVNHMNHRIYKGILADDVIIWTVDERSYGDRLAVKYRLEDTLELVAGWYRSNRLKLNATKTQALRFSLAREDNSVKIDFQGLTLEWSSHLKYLGIVFDKRLSWQHQAKAVSAKVEARLAGLRRLRGKSFKLPSPLALLVYKSYVRPVMEYGCEGTLAMIPHRLDVLQKLQNRALRTCLGRDRYTRLSELHELGGVPLLEDRFRLHVVRYVVRAIENQTLVGRELLRDLRETPVEPSRPSVVSPLDLVREILSVLDKSD